VLRSEFAQVRKGNGSPYALALGTLRGGAFPAGFRPWRTRGSAVRDEPGPPWRQSPAIGDPDAITRRVLLGREWARIPVYAVYGRDLRFDGGEVSPRQHLRQLLVEFLIRCFPSGVIRGASQVQL